LIEKKILKRWKVILIIDSIISKPLQKGYFNRYNFSKKKYSINKKFVDRVKFILKLITSIKYIRFSNKLRNKNFYYEVSYSNNRIIQIKKYHSIDVDYLNYKNGIFISSLQKLIIYLSTYLLNFKLICLSVVDWSDTYVSGLADFVNNKIYCDILEIKNIYMVI